MSARTDRLDILRDAYPADEQAAHDTTRDEGEPRRYLAVSECGRDKTFFLSSHVAEQEAFDQLGDGVLDGWSPVGVFDLDTGDMVDVHISTPAVTRSEDQGISFNPLEGEPCEECGEEIPDVPAGGLANRRHAPSCSLHSADQP
jgi:hypothetical protein